MKSWRGFFSSVNYNNVSLRKQPTFGDATTGFLTKWRLRNECWNSILMMRHYPDLGNASDLIGRAASQIYFNQPAQAAPDPRHQYGISALVSQTSFGGETSGSVANCRLFSQANYQHLVVVYTAALSPTIAIHPLLLTHFTIKQMQLHINQQLSTITPNSFWP